MSGTQTLSLLQHGAGNTLVQSLSSAYRSGAFATGAAKLLQNVLVELLTLRGSVRCDPKFGCDLVGMLGVTNVASLAEVSHTLNIAVSDVKVNIQSRVLGKEPLEEILESIEVEQLQQRLDHVLVTLRVVSRAGNSSSYDLAIKF